MKEYLFDLIKELCLIDGVSGNEDKVREAIIRHIDGKCEYSVDALGNIVGKKGSGGDIFIDAHMDEVGFIVTEIDEKGYLKIHNVGGIDTRILPAARVSVNGIPGVICAKPIHLMKDDERSKPISKNNLLVDIGAESKEEAQKHVRVGDVVSFARHFERFGADNDSICAPALDDRVGCAVIIALIEKTDLDFYFSFSVQEEIGCRGAAAAAFKVDCERAVAIETTTAADIPGNDELNDVCRLGEGAVVSFMDRSTLYDKHEFDKLFDIARKNGIKAQPKRAVAGGNDMGAIHKTAAGKRAASVATPARYLHSPNVVIRLSDAVCVYELLKKYI